jgi:hypothetical protein
VRASVKFSGVLSAVALVAVSPGLAQIASDGKPKVAITKAGQARAYRIILKLGDFGPGWRAEKDAGKDNSYVDCFENGGDLSSTTIKGEAASPAFVRGGLPYATSLAVVFATSQQARLAFRLNRTAFRDCVVDVLRKVTGVRKASGGALGFPRLGARSAAFRVVATSEPAYGSIVVHFDFVIIEQAGAVGVVNFAGAATAPFDQAQKEHLARVVAQRMKRAA